jgi:hypothetical protein
MGADIPQYNLVNLWSINNKQLCNTMSLKSLCFSKINDKNEFLFFLFFTLDENTL